MRWFLLLSGLPLFWSCERWNHHLHSQVLECGEAAREGGLWIKVLDPQGKELPEAEQLDARVLEVNADGSLPSALPVSQKHCVNTRGASRLVIRSLAQDRSWSVLIPDARTLPQARIQLQDNSQARVRLRCPEPWIQNGRFTLPLETNSSMTLDAWALAPTLQGSDGRVMEQSFSLQSSAPHFIWPKDWPDGPGLLTLRQRNLLQNPRSPLAELVESCALIIDRQKPILRLTPAGNVAGELEMPPGSLVKLHIEDQHPAMIQWCLQPYDQNICDASDAWQTVKGEASLPMPDQGGWILKARGWDLAGHEAEPLQKVIDIVRHDLIQGIGARVDQALAEKNDQGWDASLSLLRALTDFRRLNAGKEQDLIRRKIVNGILGASPYLQEFQRATLPSMARRAWALHDSENSPWLIQADTEISLWSAQGHRLNGMNVPLAWAADWSSSSQALALATDGELWVIRVEGSAWTETFKLRWRDHEDITSEANGLHWVPGGKQMLVTFPDSKPAMVRLGAAGLSLTQRLDTHEIKFLSLSQDGQQLAIADQKDIVRVWRQDSGLWVLQDEKALESSGLSFAGAGEGTRLIVFLRDGRLISWKPGTIWKDIDAGVPGEKPTESGTSIPIPPLQAWNDGRAGIMERGGRFYEWSADPGKTLQPLKFSGFDWNTLRNWKVDPCQRGIWMQDQRSLSYWEWQDGPEPGVYKIRDWFLGSASSSFAVACQRDQKRFLTLSGQRVRFWSQRGPLPLIRGDQDDVTVSRFEKGPDQKEVLFTAGFDGIIRLWDQTGQKLQEWIGHKGQVNEVLYLSDWNLFASSAEDSTSRLWTQEGREEANLNLLSLPNASRRDAALAFDAERMLTTGSGVIALWSQKSPRKELTITISLQPRERTGPGALVRLPGSSRILVRLMKGNVIRALVVTPDGTLVKEPGLPVLENLKWLEWTRDGSRLAFADAQQKPVLYRYEAGQWKEESLPTKGMQSFAFAPDGTTFAALGSRNQLIIGQWNQGTWSLTEDIPLAPVALEKGIHWTSDSKAFVTLQAGQVFVRDRNGRLLYQFQAFPGADVFHSIGLSQDPELLAVGAKEWVRILDLNLERLQSQLCTWLDAYLKGPDAPPDLVPLCSRQSS